MDVILILETLSQHGLVKLNRQMNDWYSVYCPFHAGGGSDGFERRPSCGVSLQMQVRNGQTYPEGMWHCFTCAAAYSMEDGVTKILQSRDIDMLGKDWLAQNVPGYEAEDDFDYLIPQTTMQNLTNKYAIEYVRQMTEPEQSFVSEEELASYRYVVPYMYERKLTDEIIEKYDVGYDANWIPPGRKRAVPCITFPVRDRQGRTLFLCRRSIAGKLYNYPTGITKPVYGVDMLPQGTSSIIICESIINALTAVSYGYNAVALLGTGNQLQMQQLKELGAQEFVICTDGDEAGRRAAAKLKKYLKSVAMVWVIHMPDEKDLNDLDKEEFDKLYQERE